MIPAKQVAMFGQEMENTGVNYKVVISAGAKHSFANPDAGEYGRKFNPPPAYDAAADKALWGETRRFLADIFRSE